MSILLNNYWYKVLEGDENSFKLLFRELFSDLCNYAYQYTTDRFLSEEIVQDVFIKIWLDKEKITLNKSIKSYIYQSVHNSCINSLIQKKNKKQINNVLLSDESWAFIKESQPINSFLLEKLEAEDTKRMIQQIMLTLPAGSGEIFKLSRLENRSHQEIAEILNISVSTVRTQIFRVLEKISEGLSKNS
ncbi:MAG: RNA polymerase sigma-70 factor [Bacteroidota bacterium]|nr:RNA polymerase sigma-70 factor [Bacteroidota bacterium]